MANPGAVPPWVQHAVPPWVEDRPASNEPEEFLLTPRMGTGNEDPLAVQIITSSEQSSLLLAQIIERRLNLSMSAAGSFFAPEAEQTSSIPPPAQQRLDKDGADHLKQTMQMLPGSRSAAVLLAGFPQMSQAVTLKKLKAQQVLKGILPPRPPQKQDVGAPVFFGKTSSKVLAFGATLVNNRPTTAAWHQTIPMKPQNYAQGGSRVHSGMVMNPWDTSVQESTQPRQIVAAVQAPSLRRTLLRRSMLTVLRLSKLREPKAVDHSASHPSPKQREDMYMYAALWNRWSPTIIVPCEPPLLNKVRSTHVPDRRKSIKSQPSQVKDGTLVSRDIPYIHFAGLGEESKNEGAQVFKVFKYHYESYQLDTLFQANIESFSSLQQVILTQFLPLYLRQKITPVLGALSYGCAAMHFSNALLETCFHGARALFPLDGRHLPPHRGLNLPASVRRWETSRRFLPQCMPLFRHSTPTLQVLASYFDLPEAHSDEQTTERSRLFARRRCDIALLDAAHYTITVDYAWDIAHQIMKLIDQLPEPGLQLSPSVADVFPGAVSNDVASAASFAKRPSVGTWLLPRLWKKDKRPV